MDQELKLKYIDKLEEIGEQDGGITTEQQDILMELYELYGITPCFKCPENNGYGCESNQEFDFIVKNYCAPRTISVLSKE